MNHHSPEKIKQTINEKYIDIMIANYKIWPMAQIVNFYFVPLNYRYVLFLILRKKNLMEFQISVLYLLRHLPLSGTHTTRGSLEKSDPSYLIKQYFQRLIY